MSYKFMSFHKPDDHNAVQWAERSIEGEIESCETRTLVEIFDKYIVDKKMKILEAGCGLGGWVNYYSTKGFQIIGIEIDKNIVDQVKKYDSKIPVEHGDIFNIDYPKEQFDAYISLGVVEHFEEGPHKPINEANRVLKTGGIAFVTVPYLSWFRRLFVHPLRNIFFFVYKLLGKKTYFWEYRYSKNEMINFLKDAGFEIIDIDIDDYIRTDKKHHIGLYGDFFFLRKKNGAIWELNTLGKFTLFFSRLFSPWLACSGIHLVAKKK